MNHKSKTVNEINKTRVLQFPLTVDYGNLISSSGSRAGAGGDGQPTELQIDLMGEGEITAEWALLIAPSWHAGHRYVRDDERPVQSARGDSAGLAAG